ncbi:tetratricopeptide repeat protein [Leptothermofonsia sp. ETS-13]|uniref:tetratricopeptide repeat protein n=1 Tax=Leptothermofonsia sp. ETS-13 TaxID=3035696 RepID=UPI003B9E7243
MKKQTAFLFSLLVAVGLATGAVESNRLAIAHQPDTHHAKADEPGSHRAHKPYAPLYKNLGNYHHPISTRNQLAQRYFDQGLTLAYGFNHDAAARSFKEAAKLDSNCAMCYWGIAYVLGPNINAPMEKDAVPEAWEALQTAIQLSKNASDKERAYIQALATRYPRQHVEDRKPYDIAYANAMREVAKKYPNDLDAATLFAEALMDTTPWDYWEEDGTPKPEGVEIIATLEAILKKNPNHAGANHLYIHAVEKERPELGLPSADRLMKLVPGSGHLVHMASHIYIRTGRYHDAVLSNQLGIKADDEYAAICHAQGIYPLAYMPHNHHFLWFAALMTGQSEVAMNAAIQTAKVDPKIMRQPDMAGSLQHYYTIPMFTNARFGRWDAILAQADPDPDLKYPNGVYHYVRGMAYLAKDQPEQAVQELKQLQAIAADPTLKDIKIWGFNPTASILDIATEVLSGEVAVKQGNFNAAIAHLQKAVKLEDALVYTEPADWYQPARQSLGAILLQAGRASEAEQVYREDLKIYPENGWSLYGLAKSLQAQGKTEEAQVVKKRFKEAWKYADVKLTASRF